jgi:hypothetical protein
MLWPSRKKRTAKKSTNRNSLVPNEGGFRPAGSVVFNELAIDLILNTSVNLGAVRQGQTGETSPLRSLTLDSAILNERYGLITTVTSGLPVIRPED